MPAPKLDPLTGTPVGDPIPTNPKKGTTEVLESNDQYTVERVHSAAGWTTAVIPVPGSDFEAQCAKEDELEKMGSVDQLSIVKTLLDRLAKGDDIKAASAEALAALTPE